MTVLATTRAAQWREIGDSHVGERDRKDDGWHNEGGEGGTMAIATSVNETQG